VNESQWYNTHEHKLLEQYTGQWIAIQGDVVIAHGPTLADVFSNVSAQGIADALFIHVHDRSAYLIAGVSR